MMIKRASKALGVFVVAAAIGYVSVTAYGHTQDGWRAAASDHTAAQVKPAAAAPTRAARVPMVRVGDSSSSPTPSPSESSTPPSSPEPTSSWGPPTSSPTPTPTPTPSPSTTPTPGNPGNYGVPAGTGLISYKGDLHVTKPGTTISNRDINGRVIIEANNVTIVNSVIHSTLNSNGGLITSTSPSYHFTVSHSELKSDTPTPYVSAIIGSNFTASHLNIHDVVDAIDITGDNVSVISSWLHANLHFAKDPNHDNGTHDDSIQIQAGSNIVLNGNRMEDAHNAAVMVTQDTGAVRSLRVEKNFLDGGACTVNVVEGSYGAEQDLDVSDNAFGTNTTYWKCSILMPAQLQATTNDNKYPDGTQVGRTNAA